MRLLRELVEYEETDETENQEKRNDLILVLTQRIPNTLKGYQNSTPRLLARGTF